ncbi:hypothetical protein WJX73_008943 [Symbiochloris irregularis]|uniref:JmjC domain-containing protein n=1 Tax=Symbiochloris irregularis TaxID=706552 RepID=A0AAW1P6P7_9CHLO
MLELPAESNAFTLLQGAVLDWPAYTLWQGKAGLERLAALAGSEPVQVLASSTPLQAGSLHKRSSLTCSFSKFLSTADTPNQVSPGQYLYLAQSAMQGRDAPLSALREDIRTPDCLQAQRVREVNLWMCTRGSRSSLHCDPYENLLCVVRGCKTVRLFPPAATPLLYPEPLWGEAANHSAVDHEHPDEVRHARYAEALQQRREVVVEAGDALYIPQGWWHQVDSADVTIAVNFWWQSPAASAAQGPAAAFLLRESLRTLTQAHMAHLLAAVTPAPGLLAAAQAAFSGQPLDRPESQQGDGGPTTGRALLLGHLSLLPPVRAEGDPVGLQAPVTRVLASLTPAETMAALQVLADALPQSCVTLLSNHLSPAAAELLTSYFEDESNDFAGLPFNKGRFFEQLYSLFKKPEHLLDLLVVGKETFAQLAFREVAQSHLGL